MEREYIIELPKIADRRGNLSFFEAENHIPFSIARSYWIYDVPGGESKSGSAYKNNKEFIVALSGSFDIVIRDGKEIRKYHMNRSYYGLYIPNMLWRELENFSTNSLALIVASTKYEDTQYIRDFNFYKKHIDA